MYSVFGPGFSIPDPCLVLIFSSLVLFNLSTGQFPQSTLQVQTKRRLAVDLTDNFTASLVVLRIRSFTVRSLSLSFLAHPHSFFFLIISTSLLNDSSFFHGQPFYQTSATSLEGRLLPKGSITVWKAFIITPISASSLRNTSFALKCSFWLWKASLLLNIKSCLIWKAV